MKRFTQCKVVWACADSPEKRRNLVELAHLAGFYSVNMQFPAAVLPECAVNPDVLYLWPGAAAPRDNIIPVCLDGDFSTQWAALFNELAARGPFEQTACPPHGYRAASGQDSAPLLPLHNGGLEDLFSPGFILYDNDNDGLADAVDCRLLLPDDTAKAQFQAACDLAARLGMETAGLRFPLTLTADDGRSSLIGFSASDEPSVTLDQLQPRRLVTIHGTGQMLTGFTSLLCRQFPWAADHRSLYDAAQHLRAAVRMANADGQTAVLAMTQGPVQALLSADAPLEVLQPLFPHADLRRHTDFAPIFTHTFDIPWEVDDVRAVLLAALDSLTPGSRILLHGFISEDAGVRQELAAWFQAQALQRGAASVEAELLCAYKPGLSWLEESFAPRAAALGGVKRVEIFFNPHLRPGIPVQRPDGSPWQQVDDLVDKPPRWLQELYPADELIAPLLGIRKEDILFDAYTGPENITYEARAYDEKGRCLLRDAFKVNVSEQWYLPRFPEQGVCAPTTGRIVVEQDGRPLLDHVIATDSERLWAIYQQDILPALADFIVSKTSDGEAPQPPLFGRLVLDICISEPERTLPTRCDLLSMGEVLSEDLFDAGKAFISALCMEKWGCRIDAAGLILPRIHIRTGPPRMTAALYDHLAPVPRILHRGGILEPSCEDATVHVTQVSWDGERLVPHFTVSCSDSLAARLAPLASLTQQGVTALAHLLAPCGGMVMHCGGACLSVTLPPAPPAAKDLTVDALDLPLDRVIGYEEWQHIARQLMRVPGLDVYPAGTTFYGRTIYAVEPACPLPGYVSTVKRLLRGPSLLIGGRHHANEVSASNALAQLIQSLAGGPQARALADEMILTLIPMENADGAALLDELRREHPGWAHHSCYTPPLGRDLYAMYFQDGQINADGQAFSGIYRRVLPDVFIDVHGVPAHDWQHQFASLRGYKGLWLPRALICGFYWYCSDSRYTDNFRLNRAWADSVSRAYFSHPELQALNGQWRERFDKYAYNGFNTDFPCAFENKMLNYWIPNPYHPRHPYLSVRFPWITSVSFTSEAADEGAVGEPLRHCALAQFCHIRAGIDFCHQAGLLYHRSIERTDDGLRAVLVRLRPLLPPANTP